MTIKKINLEQGTQEWLAYRLNGVGGSDIASITGADGAFKKKQQVIMEKLGQQKALSDFQKKMFDEGHEWERLVRDRLNEQGFTFGPAVIEATFNERFFASLDGMDVEKEVLLEVKSCSSMDKFNQYIAATPEHYMMQVQWQMMVTGYATTFLAFVCQGELHVKEVHADFDLQSKLVVEATEFLHELDQIRAGSLPAPIQDITSPDVERLVALKAASVKLAEKLEEIDAEVKSLATKILADHKAVQVQNSQINIQLVEREGSVDYKKIPELANIDLNPYRKKGTSFIKVNLKS